MSAAREMYGRAAWTIGFALVVFYQNRTQYPGPSLTLLAVISLIGLGFVAAGYGFTWLAGPGRERVLNQVLSSLNLDGSEKILDAGSTGGQLGLAAARCLKSGKVVALGETSDNEAPRELAKNEGLGDRIRFESPDWKKLPYPDGNFDAVIGSAALSRMETDAQRQQGVREILRVLKPGGTLVLHEIDEWPAISKFLSAAGHIPDVQNSQLPLHLGGRILTVRKNA